MAYLRDGRRPGREPEGLSRQREVVVDGPRGMGEQRFAVIRDPAGAHMGLIGPKA